MPDTSTQPDSLDTQTRIADALEAIAETLRLLEATTAHK